MILNALELAGLRKGMWWNKMYRLWLIRPCLNILSFESMWFESNEPSVFRHLSSDVLKKMLLVLLFQVVNHIHIHTSYLIFWLQVEFPKRFKVLVYIQIDVQLFSYLLWTIYKLIKSKTTKSGLRTKKIELWKKINYVLSKNDFEVQWCYKTCV